jgi:TonB family protein
MAKDDLAAQLGAEEKSIAQKSWASQVAAAIRLRHNPVGSPSGPSKVRLVLSPTGEVQSAVTVQSSGIPAYDDSVVRAALAASPLPLPSNMSAFDPRITICLPIELCPR